MDYTIILQWLVCLIIIGFGWYIFDKLGIMDRPGKDLPPRKSVPNFQGIWIVVAFLAVFFLRYGDYIHNSKILGLIVGIVLLFLLSVGDDFVGYFNKLKGRPASVRLILQLLIISLSIYISGIYSDFNMFGYDLPDWISFLGMIIWIGMFINSINWFDGYNLGISSIVSTVGFLTIYILVTYIILPKFGNISSDQLYVLKAVSNLSIVLMFLGICSFVMEYKPIGVIRDVGIMFYGFCLGYLSLAGGAKVGILLTALGLPLLDSVWTVINRIFVMKKSPMKGDWTHLHYRLMALGWSINEIRSFVLFWSLFFMNIGIMQGLDRYNKLVIFVRMAGLFFGVNIYIFWYKKVPFEFKPKGIEGNNGEREF